MRLSGWWPWVLAASLSSGCGVKGPPKPPLEALKPALKPPLPLLVCDAGCAAP